MNIGLIAHGRFAHGLREAGFELVTGSDLRAAAMAVRAVAAETPTVVISTPDFQIPQQIVQFLEVTAPRLVVVADHELPIDTASLAQRLGFEEAAEPGTVDVDGGFLSSSDAPDWLADFAASGAEAEPDAAAPALADAIAAWDDDEGTDDPTPAPSLQRAVPEYDQILDDPGFERVPEPERVPGHEPVPESQSAAAPLHPWQLMALQPPAHSSSPPDSAQPEPAMAPPPAAPPQPAPAMAPPVAMAPPAPAQPQPAPAMAPATSTVPAEPTPDPDRLVARSDARRQTQRRHPFRANGAEVLVTFAGSGGVGKTTMSLVIAQLAGLAGLRTVLVDFNRGQPDVGKFVLRKMDSRNSRTIHNALLSNDIDDVVTTAEEANGIRRTTGASGDVAFDSVFSPSSDIHSRSLHDAALYQRVLDRLRLTYDLIVIDTQVLDNDRSELWTELLLPILSAGQAWALGLTDTTAAKQSDLRDQLTRMQADRVPNARIFAMGTRYEDDFSEGDRAAFATFFHPFEFLGVTRQDRLFRQDIESGLRITADSESVSPVLRRILYRIFELPTFEPVQPQPRRRFPWPIIKRGKR